MSGNDLNSGLHRRGTGCSKSSTKLELKQGDSTTNSGFFLKPFPFGSGGMNIDTDHSTPGSTPMTQAEEGNNPNSCASRQDNDVNSKGVNGVTKMMPSMEDISGFAPLEWFSLSAGGSPRVVDEIVSPGTAAFTPKAPVL